MNYQPVCLKKWTYWIFIGNDQANVKKILITVLTGTAVTNPLFVIFSDDATSNLRVLPIVWA